ncbi:MAG: DUF4147 domain-containing protein [Planctomycetaceae bacterium]|nr:DUF4147 domain-containing protein [Planctomycetaceae bacterium]
MHSGQSLRRDAIAVWQAGVAAVDSRTLVRDSVKVTSGQLDICGRVFAVAGLRHIEVVGAGKAGTGMAAGLLDALQPLENRVSVDGWVNVPEDCVQLLDVQSLSSIHLHGARPAGVNEPTAAAVAGTQEILRRIRRLGPDDLCVVLISGGGSALLPCPAPLITLDEKIALTRFLAASGAPIQHLNLIRTQLSEVKGGGLLRNCRAGQLVTLIISDVIGDPPEIIASGPTVLTTSTAHEALELLKTFDPDGTQISPSVYRSLDQQKSTETDPAGWPVFDNFIIGSNRTAVRAANLQAQSLGYETLDLGSANVGEARFHGAEFFRRMCAERTSRRVDGNGLCLLSGGETTVHLNSAEPPGRGGRNQEVVLGAVAAFPDADSWNGMALLSGGTDGEDGPTDAAGAVADRALLEEMHRRGLVPEDYLRNNNSYPFFEQLNGLLKTGPTHTNVMDLAVGLVAGEGSL